MKNYIIVAHTNETTILEGFSTFEEADKRLNEMTENARETEEFDNSVWLTIDDYNWRIVKETPRYHIRSVKF